jgi:ATP-dependent DNA helicase RecG
MSKQCFYPIIEYLRALVPIEFLLRKELEFIWRFIKFVSNRYIDRTQYYKINEIQNLMRSSNYWKNNNIKTVEFGKGHKRL